MSKTNHYSPSDFFSAYTLINEKNPRDQNTVNQDITSCHIIKTNNQTNHNEIWKKLFQKINDNLENARSSDPDLDIEASGSTISAILFEPDTLNFSTANIGDSRIYACFEETKGKKRKFLLALTRDDDPNDPNAAKEYRRMGGTIIEYTKSETVTRIGVAGKSKIAFLAMTASLGDYDVEDHIREPLILNFTLANIATAFAGYGPLKLTGFFAASDGFCDIEKYLIQNSETNPSNFTPFYKIRHLGVNDIKDNDDLTLRVSDPANFYCQEVANIPFSAPTQQYLQENSQYLQQLNLPHLLTLLARVIGSKDDITVAFTDLEKFYSMAAESKDAAAKDMILSFVCDGHGPQGHLVAQIIADAVFEFVKEQNVKEHKAKPTKAVAGAALDHNISDSRTSKPQAADPKAIKEQAVKSFHNFQNKIFQEIPELANDDYLDFAEFLQDYEKLLKDLERLDPEKLLTKIAKEIEELNRQIGAQVEADDNPELLTTLFERIENKYQSQRQLEGTKQRQEAQASILHKRLLTILTLAHEELGGAICQSENEFSSMIKEIIKLGQSLQPKETNTNTTDFSSFPDLAPQDGARLVSADYLTSYDAHPQHQASSTSDEQPILKKLSELDEFYSYEFSDIIKIINIQSSEENCQFLDDITKRYFICEEDKISKNDSDFLSEMYEMLNSNPDFIANYYKLVDTILDKFFGMSLDYESDEDGKTIISFDDSRPTQGNKNWMIAGTTEHKILSRITSNAAALEFDSYADQLNIIMAENVERELPSTLFRPESGDSAAKRRRFAVNY